jgi:pimeloyl-ACP methyl ester carboxylesterase
MKHFLSAALILFFVSNSSFAQKILRHELITSISMAQMDSLRMVQGVPKRLAHVRYGVDVYEIEYTSHWWDGKPVKASGFYIVPHDCTEPVPMIAYNHGTRLQRARSFKMSGEEVICAFFAADGYAVAMPDYLGHGTGDRAPIYMHAGTEASATVDMVQACKSLNVQLGIKENEQLFLTGYSQGGHAAMATQRYLQLHPEAGLKVTASAPMSGAYDLAGVQGQVIDKPYTHPGYLPFLLLSYQEVYHLLPDSAAYFKEPYNTTLLPYFDGNHKLNEVSAAMPSVPGAVMREDLLLAYKSDPENGLRKALKENTLTDWAPEAPMLMCYCKADEQVLYQNALVTRDAMEKLGSKVVHTRMAGRRFGHGICALYTSIYAKMWFDSFRDGSTKGKKGPAWNRFLVSLSKMAYKKPKPAKK